jgi:serine/threonine-protein kinase ATR
MRTHIVGLIHRGHAHSDWDRILAPFNIEASLIVSDWNAVEDALKIVDLEGPEAAFGRVITAMRQSNEEQLAKTFYDAREQLGSPIVASGKDSYQRVYDSIVHLHMLHELKTIRNHVSQRSPADSASLSKTLLARLESTAPTFRAREPILNMRRTVQSLE